MEKLAVGRAVKKPSDPQMQRLHQKIQILGGLNLRKDEKILIQRTWVVFIRSSLRQRKACFGLVV